MNTVEFIDGNAPGISAALLNEPFHVKGASYDPVMDQITVTIGSGRAGFGFTTIIEKLTDSTLIITGPSINTEYYIFLQRDSTTPFKSATSIISLDGEVLLGKVSVGETKSSLTRYDLRGMLPGSLNNNRYVIIGDNNIDLYSATTERTCKTTNFAKQFRVRFPGNYRVYFEFRASKNVINAYVNVSGGVGGGVHYTNSTTYTGKNVDLSEVKAGELIKVTLGKSGDPYNDYTSYMKNVYLRGEYTDTDPMIYGTIND